MLSNHASILSVVKIAPRPWSIVLSVRSTSRICSQRTLLTKQINWNRKEYRVVVFFNIWYILNRFFYKVPNEENIRQPFKQETRNQNKILDFCKYIYLWDFFKSRKNAKGDQIVQSFAIESTIWVKTITYRILCKDSVNNLCLKWMILAPKKYDNRLKNSVVFWGT